MAITFTDIKGLGDLMPSNMHEMMFPSFTGVDGDHLRLVTTHITVPQRAIGHIHKKILGHSVGFRGGLSFENVLSFGFMENIRGDSVSSIYNWMKEIRNPNTGAGVFKASYAKNAELTLKDTKGKKAFQFKFVNIFPISFDFGELGEESAALEHTVQFNVDHIELISKTSELKEDSAYRGGYKPAYRSILPKVAVESRNLVLNPAQFVSEYVNRLE